jgi:hypothetical protein
MKSKSFHEFVRIFVRNVESKNEVPSLWSMGASGVLLRNRWSTSVTRHISENIWDVSCRNLSTTVLVGCPEYQRNCVGWGTQSRWWGYQDIPREASQQANRHSTWQGTSWLPSSKPNMAMGDSWISLEIIENPRIPHLHRLDWLDCSGAEERSGLNISNPPHRMRSILYTNPNVKKLLASQ